LQISYFPNLRHIKYQEGKGNGKSAGDQFKDKECVKKVMTQFFFQT